ncbi:MAG: putative Phospholipase/Transphosphatidylase [Gammaproteobacteria bacterium]|nr:putative Phospholipase/Transphosphatidylase [Gammaproteobacteria bacterium]
MAERFPTLFRPGRNCYRAARARRAALLIDGEAYFRAFAQAALRASRSIVIVGWDFHSLTRLHLRQEGVPDLLGDFLNFLVMRTGGLEVFILTWDYSLVFAKGREPSPQSGCGWRPHRRVHFRYDSGCPLGAALHQKIVVIDGALAFCGGLDLTLGRWDTSEHRTEDPRRINPGETNPYPPVHDAMLAVDAQAARALQELVSERWRSAMGKPLPAVDTGTDPWPASLAAAFRDVDVALARTVPASDGEPAVAEIQALHLDMIAAARDYIYLENQYFTAKALGDALAARLAEPDGPEVIVVLRLASGGWLEARTMAALRTVLLRKLREADRYGRFHPCYPYLAEASGQPCCDVHAKLMIVDDEWLRVGSANFANRSMGLDTECDLVIEARGDPLRRATIAAARDGLLAEHLDVCVPEVQGALQATGSLRAAIRSLTKSSGRTLRCFERLDEPSPAVVALAHGVADPERPLAVDELIAGFVPGRAGRVARRGRLAAASLRLAPFLGGATFGIMSGTLVATELTRPFATEFYHARPLDLWLLMATFGAIAAGTTWVMRRRRVLGFRLSERARRP